MVIQAWLSISSLASWAYNQALPYKQVLHGKPLQGAIIGPRLPFRPPQELQNTVLNLSLIIHPETLIHNESTSSFLDSEQGMDGFAVGF